MRVPQLLRHLVHPDEGVVLVVPVPGAQHHPVLVRLQLASLLQGAVGGSHDPALRHEASPTECLVVPRQAGDRQLLLDVSPFTGFGEHRQPGVLVPHRLFTSNDLRRGSKDPASVRPFLSGGETFLSRSFPVQVHLVADLIEGQKESPVWRRVHWMGSKKPGI